MLFLEFQKTNYLVDKEAEYTINMHRISKIEQIMVSECKKIYKDIKKDFNDISNKVWILHNINLAEEENKPDDIEMHWLMESGTIGKPIPYPGRNFSEIDDNGFIINPEMHFNIFLKEKRVLLVYYFGKRLTRCIEYDLKCVDEEYTIENPRVLWAG